MSKIVTEILTKEKILELKKDFEQNMVPNEQWEFLTLNSKSIKVLLDGDSAYFKFKGRNKISFNFELGIVPSEGLVSLLEYLGFETEVL